MRTKVCDHHIFRSFPASIFCFRSSVCSERNSEYKYILQLCLVPLFGGKHRVSSARGSRRRGSIFDFHATNSLVISGKEKEVQKETRGQILIRDFIIKFYWTYYSEQIGISADLHFLLQCVKVAEAVITRDLQEKAEHVYGQEENVESTFYGELLLCKGGQIQQQKSNMVYALFYRQEDLLAAAADSLTMGYDFRRRLWFRPSRRSVRPSRRSVPYPPKKTHTHTHTHKIKSDFPFFFT